MATQRVGFILGSGRMGRLHQKRLEAFGVKTNMFDGAEACRAFLRDHQKYTTEPDTSYFVVIATPASSHYEYVKSALLFGFSVFAEKPLATSLADAEELIQLAKEQQKLLFVGHSECYSNAFQKTLPFLADMAKHDELESLSFVRYNLTSDRGRDVSMVWDIGIHDYALFYELKKSIPQTNWRKVRVTFDENRAAGYSMRMIYANFRGPEGKKPFWRLDLNPTHYATLKTHKNSIHIPTDNSTDAISNEQREFLHLLNLPLADRQRKMLQNLEMARFAVQTAELYSTSPNSPK